MYTRIIRDQRDYREISGVADPRDTYIQLVVSTIAGILAFLIFCILRPRWTTLYSARKKQSLQANSLPTLPNTPFSWICTLWNITSQTTLICAGLDAYAFLKFYKLGIKLLSITLIFSLLIIKPVHDQYPDDSTPNKDINVSEFHSSLQVPLLSESRQRDTGYLWMYLIFAYFFSAMAMLILVSETHDLIKVRQEYFGTKMCINDRTIRLSGIPKQYRSKGKIKAFIEGLEIGKVDSVSLCRNWRKLDNAMIQRNELVDKLERDYTYLGKRMRKVFRESENTRGNTEPNNITNEPSHSSIQGYTSTESNSHECNHTDDDFENINFSSQAIKAFWSCNWDILYPKIKQIIQNEEHLRVLDEKIEQLRTYDFSPTSTAFITMDSVASCQMACQAVLDPSPMKFIAKYSPAPDDVIWKNVYLSRINRTLRTWTITIFIAILTVFWSALLVPIAGVLDLEHIRSIWPSLSDLLDEHRSARYLVQTQLPTLVLSLLNIAVPYLYTWLASFQGMISKGDVELSVISKNFFFVFFNFFLVFTALGTASISLDNLGNETLNETMNKLAISIQDLRRFYVNYIILQGLAIFPFRLLEFASLALYPIKLLTCSTPRQYAQLKEAPIFSYALNLPQAILILMICLVYSCLRSSWQVLTAGLIYFIAGYFCCKYQLLYAMNHFDASSGKSWIIIANRIILGIIMMQITVAAQLALRRAVRPAIMIIPLILATIWFSRAFRHAFTPLMSFIALKSIESPVKPTSTLLSECHSSTSSRPISNPSPEYINPNLYIPLDPIWLDRSANLARQALHYRIGLFESV